ncbi:MULTISPECIES: hypothetical protein [unclassified Rhodococcus (in: high G+C Gram-positive bacteria)]|uniref:hypothetical protein n=1 Tax=unclassified Rhodococcus (in: high G+C Gram-positive bacteria) TaxID=192944 RepID=UPI000B9B7378|nr:MULTISPECIES: hypothetical protein [unclassified Rhodococcus (in: high G+C Gram-positive bacteria)]OZE35670.1 hypothetical protein CH259_16735 [Rhodococcus sp. 05-2254-4]OZE48099.1 hypothetical protein CH261_09330 [Rhodococcus sp. 05-2254-3]OZE49310.1 hypothetical protein CH283_17115 [Rhodococcus sp. 05-2254-2]
MSAALASDAEAMKLLADVTELVRATDPDSWWEGPTFRSPCQTKHCVLSHVADVLGMDAMDQFESTWSSSYVIGAGVNDKPTEKYPQSHPKDRVLAFLENLRTGAEEDVVTGMDRCFLDSEARKAGAA